MSRAKMGLVVFVALAGLSAIPVGSASANWFVNGAELNGSAGLSTTAKVDLFPKFLVPAINFVVECSGATFDGKSPEILGPGATGKDASLKFLSCNTTKPASGCELNEKNAVLTTIGVNTREFLAAGVEDRVLFSPQTKKTFAEIQFSEGNTCAFTGVIPVKGAVTGAVPTGQTEEVGQALVALGSLENSSLELGSGNKIYVSGGTALIALAGGSKWSFK
jgi:hypothetical protein